MNNWDFLLIRYNYVSIKLYFDKIIFPFNQFFLNFVILKRK
jgi:hypothetical protein